MSCTGTPVRRGWSLTSSCLFYGIFAFPAPRSVRLRLPLLPLPRRPEVAFPFLTTLHATALPDSTLSSVHAEQPLAVASLTDVSIFESCYDPEFEEDDGTGDGEGGQYRSEGEGEEKVHDAGSSSSSSSPSSSSLLPIDPPSLAPLPPMPLLRSLTYDTLMRTSIPVPESASTGSGSDSVNVSVSECVPVASESGSIG